MRKRPLECGDIKKPTRYYSRIQEKNVAKKIGGEVVPNSGATPFYKGDVVDRDGTFLIECKTCIEEKKSFSIKKEWLEKLREEAFAKGSPHFALFFNFGGSLEENYVIISEKDFLKYQKSLNTEYEDGRN